MRAAHAQWLFLQGNGSLIDDEQLRVPHDRWWIVLAAHFAFFGAITPSTDLRFDVEPGDPGAAVTFDNALAHRGPVGPSERWSITRPLAVPPGAKITPLAPSIGGGEILTFAMLFVTEDA
jgi:hypothetical protein